MKVLSLQCSHRHSFEGWFASEGDFQEQLGHGQIECPLCGDKGIHKLPSAPRLNLGAFQTGEQAQDTTVSGSHLKAARAATPEVASLENDRARSTIPVLEMSAGISPAEQAAFLRALRKVVAQAQDVGDRFALEARRMHYGEIEPRSILGQTSVREALELLEEGIDVLPLPPLPGLKETLQ